MLKPFLMCSDCRKTHIDKKTFESIKVYGNCSICGDGFGRKTIYVERLRTKKVEEVKKIVEDMRNWNSLLLKNHPENALPFLTEVPTERLKPGIKRVLHLHFSPKNIKCVFAQETKKGIEFVCGIHHDNFCPVTKPTQLKR